MSAFDLIQERLPLYYYLVEKFKFWWRTGWHLGPPSY